MRGRSQPDGRRGAAKVTGAPLHRGGPGVLTAPLVVAQVVRVRVTTEQMIQLVSAFFVGVGATVAVYQVVLGRRAARPRLTIKGRPCFLPGARPDPGYPFYCFAVTNPGERAVTLDNIQIGVRDGQSIAYPRIEGDRPLPCRIEPQEAAQYWIEFGPLQDRLEQLGYSGEAEVTIRAHDALGGVYETPTRINLRLS
jgi:hypothetical protein